MARSKGYVDKPNSLGEHLLKRRTQLGLTQTQAATQLLTNGSTVLDWEKDRTLPPIRFYPAIFRFLGYDPFPAPKSTPERIFAQRRALGLTIEAAAERTGVDEGTFSRWERGMWLPKNSMAAVRRFLALPPPAEA